MKALNIFYYYYYLFYKNILKEDMPIFTATFAFSFSISLFINSVIDIILAHKLKSYLNANYSFGIFLCILFIVYYYYNKKDKLSELIETKPKFYDSNKLSIILTILFFIITFSLLFLEPIYSKDIIDGN